MWKKTAPTTAEKFEQKPTPPSIRENQSDARALVGPSITITGGLAGEEDVTIEGTVEGTVEFREHSVIVGPHGRVKADIYAKDIKIEGKLEGDLYGEERIEISKTGVVNGNIHAPRIIMEDGCKFKGRVDMEPGEEIEQTLNHQKELGKIPPLANNIKEPSSNPAIKTRLG